MDKSKDPLKELEFSINTMVNHMAEMNKKLISLQLRKTDTLAIEKSETRLIEEINTLQRAIMVENKEMVSDLILQLPKKTNTMSISKEFYKYIIWFSVLFSIICLSALGFMYSRFKDLLQLIDKNPSAIKYEYIKSIATPKSWEYLRRIDSLYEAQGADEFIKQTKNNQSKNL